MITTTPARVAGVGPSLRRAGAVAARDLTMLRGAGSYWWVVFSGFVEPLLYLFAIGWGVGQLVGDLPLPDGREVPYLTFLAPALLAVSVMNGALAEATMNFFAKMRFAKLYHPVLNTPVTAVEIALGELGWAMVRGAMYGGAFLVVMVVMGLTTPALALLAFPVTLLVGLAFGSLGLSLATVLRSWQDFDYVGIAQAAMFLFSGTFVPLSSYPAAAQVIVQVTPLYHGVALLREVALGQFSWGLLGHMLYLVAVTALGITVTVRRIGRRLRT